MSPDSGADRERWRALKALFNDAVERPRHEWQSFVEDVRRRDVALGDELRRLLDGHQESFIHVAPRIVDELSPGDVLGPYRLVGLIGEGGMGQVYRATDARLGRDVAIKVLPPALVDDPDRRERLDREARAMGRLNHPNVVTVYDVGEHQGAPFIVSELLEGRTLRALMTDAAETGVRVAPEHAIAIVTAVSDALSAAHRQGIVHRDIKPENIFLTADGRTKVLDFGIARVIAGPAAPAVTVAGALVGTLGYMAAEQLRGEPAGPQADVYACGVVLYELLSGRRPFIAESQAALIGAVLHEAPLPLNDAAPVLTALVARCLDKRAEARFEDGNALAMALRALPSDAAAPAVTPRPAPRARRVALVAAGLLFLALVAMGVASWRTMPRGTAAPTATAAPADAMAQTPPPPPVTSPEPRAPVTVAAPPSTGRPAGISTRPADGDRAATPVPDAARSETPLTPATSPAGTASSVVPTSLDGVWTLSEQIAEDVASIECTASGALQLRGGDGLLDGTLRIQRDCAAVTQGTTDSTHGSSALSAATITGDQIAFATRVVDEGLTTTCRYSGRIVGSARSAMAGEVACEARSAGLSGVLALRGTWRASKTAP